MPCCEIGESVFKRENLDVNVGGVTGISQILPVSSLVRRQHHKEGERCGGGARVGNLVQVLALPFPNSVTWGNLRSLLPFIAKGK